jgi:8-oxo-dGTP pyrophosphatase MutT (NUDIX family)
MVDVAHFLSSPPLSPSIEEIRRALDQKHVHTSIHNPDQLLSPDAYDLNFKSAAVLIPIWKHHTNGQLHVLLTQRAKHMRNHPGQIAFPGGQFDPQDSSIIHTAFRETQEEVGLSPECFELLGELGDYLTISGFCVKPVLAEIKALPELSLCYDEVDAVHWVPLNYLMTPANYRFQQRNLANIRRGFFEIHYGDITIWGVTAGILYGLYQSIAHLATQPNQN